MNSGASGGWRSLGSREAIPNPHQPGLAGSWVYQDIGGLDVLMDDSALMQLADRSRKANRPPQGGP
jgi:hypothetical protein